MKALSLKQPWAELILLGKKKMEIRKWNTKFRGTFLIHASKNMDKKAIEKFGFEKLQTGGIVGKADLIDVKKYDNEEDFGKDKNMHLATKNFGNYGFILKNVKRLEFQPLKGKLNFFNV